ncbi:MAG: hypothetical protein A3I05_03505 [Deltaproteobacteria bacterium RIFCSPLOWO2_02_FULL_44_10]|nr:MAG: hypothetical protein A3C46_03080 [Deltaproteobacteria bacterium RIFCSPHIGHO2_02_FULL_44_16]OGQ46239.1 MAG: hypothetical protein A3I05_03505 [Deltaproteobacteria bacterium RIFCSPLOWO2_02_FULL_44_10]
MNKPLFQQLQNVQRKIESSARKSGQDPTVIQLIAVSKGVSTDLIREAYDAGQRDFGENYAQEMKEKAALLHDLEIRWHFIGHLQRNKVKLVAPITTSIVIDSMKTAVAIDLFRNSMVRVTPERVPGGSPANSGRAGTPQAAGPVTKECFERDSIDLFLEINIGGESSKSGMTPKDAAELLHQMQSLQHLRVKGLICIPPYDPNPEASRPYFRQMRELAEQLDLKELSMGMSHDFDIAIEEGATIIRVGTAIFGERRQNTSEK